MQSKIIRYHRRDAMMTPLISLMQAARRSLIRLLFRRQINKYDVYLRNVLVNIEQTYSIQL